MLKNTQRQLGVEIYQLLDYQIALQLQQRHLEERRQNLICDRLLLLEHPSVYTMGRRASWQCLRCPVELLPAPLHKGSRGGEITYHGPGQLIGYLIALLDDSPFGLRELVWRLEQTFIDLLDKNWNLPAVRDPKHRGVWINNHKILAIGLAVHRGVTMHGFAFNVCPDLSYYRSIIPCGIADRGVTTLEQVLNSTTLLPGINEIKNLVAEELCCQLEYQCFNYLDIELNDVCKELL